MRRVDAQPKERRDAAGRDATPRRPHRAGPAPRLGGPAPRPGGPAHAADVLGNRGLLQAWRARQTEGGGAPLETGVRGRFERLLGRDLGGVRVHTGPAADRATRGIDAVAATSGADISFRGGAYAPATPEGTRLLGHELIHVVQQRDAPSLATSLRVSAPGDAAEREADRGAAELAAGRPFRPAERASGIHRQTTATGCGAATVTGVHQSAGVQKAMREMLERLMDDPDNERGYYIVQDDKCNIDAVFCSDCTVVTLPDMRQISFPRAAGETIDGKTIVGKIHSHPAEHAVKTGSSLLMGPSSMDRTKVVNEELVLDRFYAYVQFPDGSWRTLGESWRVAGMSEADATKLGLPVKPPMAAPGLGEVTRDLYRIDDKGLIQQLQEVDLAVVIFGATWCDPCHTLFAELDPIAGELSARMLYIDTDTFPDIEKTFPLPPDAEGKAVVPHIVFFQKGREVHRMIGLTPHPQAAVAEQVYTAHLIRRKIDELVHGPTQPKRNLIVFDLGALAAGDRGAAVAGVGYLRVVKTWLSNRLQLAVGGVVSSSFTGGDVEKPGFAVEPRASLTYYPGNPTRGLFGEVVGGLPIGKLVGEEDVTRIGLRGRVGVGYDLGGGRVAIYADVVASDAQEDSLLKGALLTLTKEF